MQCCCSGRSSERASRSAASPHCSDASPGGPRSSATSSAPRTSLGARSTEAGAEQAATQSVAKSDAGMRAIGMPRIYPGAPSRWCYVPRVSGLLRPATAGCAESPIPRDAMLRRASLGPRSRAPWTMGLAPQPRSRVSFAHGIRDEDSTPCQRASGGARPALLRRRCRETTSMGPGRGVALRRDVGLRGGHRRGQPIVRKRRAPVLRRPEQPRDVPRTLHLRPRRHLRGRAPPASAGR